MTEVLPLSALREGQCGSIVDLSGPDRWVHQLEEIGLRVGTSVELVKAGEPCIIGLGSQRLSIRFDPAVMILVETL